MRVLLMAIVVALMTACAVTRPRTTTLAQCESPGGDWERSDISIAVAANIDTIDITQFVGSVFVRPGPTDRIEVHAVVQCLTQSAGAATVVASEQESRLQLAVRFAGQSAEREWSTSDGRADVTLWLPVDRKLILRTTSGGIEINGAKNGVVATTASGDIHVAAKGPMLLTSATGNIHASQRDTLRGHESTLQTAANISANVLSDVPMSVAARTCGVLDSDLENAKRYVDQQGCTWLAWAQSGSVNAPMLRIASVSGRVDIREQVTLANDDQGTKR